MTRRGSIPWSAESPVLRRLVREQGAMAQTVYRKGSPRDAVSRAVRVALRRQELVSVACPRWSDGPAFAAQLVFDLEATAPPVRVAVLDLARFAGRKAENTWSAVLTHLADALGAAAREVAHPLSARGFQSAVRTVLSRAKGPAALVVLAAERSAVGLVRDLLEAVAAHHASLVGRPLGVLVCGARAAKHLQRLGGQQWVLPDHDAAGAELAVVQEQAAPTREGVRWVVHTAGRVPAFLRLAAVSEGVAARDRDRVFADVMAGLPALRMSLDLVAADPQLADRFDLLGMRAGHVAPYDPRDDALVQAGLAVREGEQTRLRSPLLARALG